jgi:hypothetical protein
MSEGSAATPRAGDEARARYKTGSSSVTVRTGDEVPFAQFLHYAYHAGGCFKWSDDNVFHVENDCSCGLAELFGGDPCPCNSCSHHRSPVEKSVRERIAEGRRARERGGRPEA